MMTSEESDSLSTIPSDGHPEDASASGTEEAPSSMVSSEAESDGSVLSEPPRHDAGDLSHADVSSDQQDDKMLGTAPDVRAVGTTLATLVSTRGSMLPWVPHKGTMVATSDTDLRPGEFVMRLLFTEFTVQAERKMEAVMAEPLEKPLNKTLQRGEDPQLDQILSAFGTVAEHCLPSLLRALFGWLERQMAESPQLSEQAKKPHQDLRNKSIIYIVSGSSGAGTEQVERSSEELQAERRDLAVEFLFCLALIEVLRQLPFHPGHEDLVQYIENVAFKRFNYKEGLQSNPNAANVHIIADLYAEVIGVLAQSRFASVRKRFTLELKDLKSREPSPHTTQSIISLLMGMKFFRVKMVPIEEFEASFQFLQECAQYFLEVKDKDIRHALAGLFVEILVPVAATVKNEVNVPCLKNFVEMLYSHTLDTSTKSKHRLALFPLVTCLLCVSQKQFFLANLHCFLAMCLSHLKNRDPKMCRVALESLYRLLWVYMIRIKCESNSATQSRLQSIVNSLFPKGSKGVVPRDTPLNIFVKIIQFIAQERLDFAMREIVFDLLMVGRPIKIILTPERMSIGLRAFLVVADSLQQKEGEPPMPRTSGTLPSGNTLRVKKTFLNKMLTDETARSIGMSAYFPYVRRVLVEILRALDAHYGRPLMLTNTQNVTKEQEINTGERKPRIDLFRTCVAAIPRLIPEGMSPNELVDLLCRLTVHMDEELRGLSFQSLQTLIVDFPEWRQDVLAGFTQFLAKEVQDTSPQLVENGLRMLLQLVTSWKNGEPSTSAPPRPEPLASVIRGTEALGLVMLCQCKAYPRRLAVHILREIKYLLERLQLTRDEPALFDVADAHVPYFTEKCLPILPPAEKQAVLAAGQPDLVWVAERVHPVWTAGLQHDETSSKNSWSGSSTNGADPWEVVLFGLLERSRVPSQCPATVLQAWPILHARIHALYTIIEPAPVNDNRASLLSRGPALPRKPEKERDGYMQVWKYYMTMAYLVVPAVPSPIIRCASPDLSLSTEDRGEWTGAQLSSSTESLNTPGGFFTLPLSYARSYKQHKRTSSSPDSLSERSGGEARGTHAAPASLHKLAVPLARCEVPEVRDAAVAACGHINPDALKDLFEELTPLLREAVDRKQENMRRRRRRDALRLHLNKMLLIIAQRKTFATSSYALEDGCLHSSITEYLDGVRQCLEVEAEKDAPAAREQRLTFADFVTELIKSFPLEMYESLLKKELCKSLFSLFAGWCGPLSKHLGALEPQPPATEIDDRLNLAALKAMSTLVCCGPCFAPAALAEDGSLYPWLSEMLSSTNDKIYELARETIVLLLDCNPDIGPLLDWTVDKCFTGAPRVADGCFMALATIFSAREYPCDHYTAIINVTLMCTGCPRAPVHESALQLLQLLDKRFFGTVGPLPTDDDGSEKGRGTLDVLLCTTYCRSQLYLSRQLSQLHPELTMPMFSEITARFQTARTEVRQLLLQYLLPWLVNIELVDPNVPPANPLSYIQYYASEAGRTGRREGLGSVEATEMVLNNLFYITVKFSDNHPKEIEELWSTLCACWPNNLKVIIRYLIIVSGMAPNELLPYAKRVVLYLARSRPERLLDEMMTELQTVETLNCLIERTETPPFYRLTSMRKATSGHSDGPGTGSQDATGRIGELAPEEKGTIHTKRHSGEDPAKAASTKSDIPRVQDKRASAPPCPSPPADEETTPPSDGDATPTGMCESGGVVSAPGTPQPRVDVLQPRPLPMPEYGGFFALLTEYLPDTNQPVSGFHRCNVAVMLLCDVVLDGVELDWSIHVPLMLHIVFLGMDHNRWIVHQHCRQLLLNLLVAVAAHHDHLTVARVLLAARSAQLGLGLPPPPLPLSPHNFTEPDAVFDNFPQCGHSPRAHVRSLSSDPQVTPEGEADNYPSLPVIVTGEAEAEPETEGEAPPAELPVADAIKSMVHFLASRPTHMALWQYEDITAKVWSLRSCQQMATLLRHTLRIFRESLPHALISERWAQTALQLGLSCPSRHYAGRSLQVFRFIGVAMTGRMVSDILSRLVETVAEQGEDMQGYVTELLLTLEAAVDSLESNFRPLDYMRDIFKSTPNLNNKDGGQHQPNGNVFAAGKRSPGVCVGCVSNHTRSTSYSVSYCMRKNTPASSEKTPHEPRTRTCDSSKGVCSNLCRSRSAQSLKLLGDTATQDDKLTILATLFWVGASLLESDYEHEFLLGVRLLSRVMARLPLDRPDARERLDRTQAHGTHGPSSLHSLLLKGCTHPNTYEPVVGVLVDVIPLLELPVIDPTQSLAFPMTVVALLPYMLLHYEDANELCVRAACHIAQFTSEKSKKLENLGTVMTLYSRRTFSKESFQWTKCVVKYLWDTYSHMSLQMLAFLVEVLEKGSVNLQLPVLSILHCMLYYVELNAPAAQAVNADLLRAVAKFIDQDGNNYKEAMKILKLVVTRCSTLVVPPHWEHTSSILDTDLHGKKELPGRTMDFTFDLSQTPVIGRKYLPKSGSQPATGPSSLSNASSATPDKAGSSTSVSASTVVDQPHSAASPRRSLSLSPADTMASGWKRPWMSQSRVRECLVNLLTTCGQRVGLPKSPSVIFSQSSELLERESSMASSLEEVSGTPGNEPSGGAPPTDHFGVFKDFDFLEYESESIEGESSDNFNWGVRRRLLSEEREEGAPERSPPPVRSRPLDHHEHHDHHDHHDHHEHHEHADHRHAKTGEDSSDEEGGWEEGSSGVRGDGGDGDVGSAHELALRARAHSLSSASSGEPDGERGDVTPVPGAGPVAAASLGVARDAWRSSVAALLRHASHQPPIALVHTLHTVLKEVTSKTISVCGEGALLAGAGGAGDLAAVLDRLSSEEPPLLWVGPAAADCARVRDAVRYAALEINEHLETYFDRREHALETLEMSRSADETGRCLYKLIFQLLLLLETNNKMVVAVYSAALDNRGVEMSAAVATVRAALAAHAGDAAAPAAPPAPAPHDDARLLHLVHRQRWGAALALVRERNAERILERGELPEDDITSLLHVYCKGLAQSHPDMVAITRPVNELSQNLSFMMESLYKVSVSLQRQEFV